jgi:hypothetical protein
LGLAGITVANFVIYAVLGLIFSVQTEKIVNNKATAIWAK